ncbi:MAG: amidohydrolase family protein [Thermoplasmata archaeon]|nr:amidohydrolase family protein [Thermoplasmata archaeon]
MPQTPGPRVDVHLHLSQHWPDLPRYSYGPGVEFTVPGLLRELDGERIGFGVLLQLETAPSVSETLREGEEMFQKSGGRLLRTSTVDPALGEAEVARAIALWEKAPDLVAIKLYPGYRHFYPHDPRLDPVYEFAHRRRITVMIHQGDTLYPDALVKYARPIHVDEVAVRFRDVPFVLCHLGNPWIDETAEVVYKNPNVYTDTSGLLGPMNLPYFDRMVERSRRRLGEALEFIGSAERILYGSDWPLLRIDVAVALIEGLPISSEDRERILGGNARKLFRLDRD